ncbi:LCP family protein [Actinopolymorpha alba]|uniref:LCP family protein n=1 Tax=Actinopolymorpha alba TaxID=533267 RepID=UPI000371A67A|nr:LCP family protein [Actinopolymorpha alba]
MPNGGDPYGPDPSPNAGQESDYGWLYDNPNQPRPRTRSRGERRGNLPPPPPPESTQVMPTNPGAYSPGGGQGGYPPDGGGYGGYPPSGGEYGGYPPGDEYGGYAGQDTYPSSGRSRAEDYPQRSTRPPGRPPGPPPGRLRGPRRRPRVRVLRILLFLLLAYLVMLVGVPLLAWSRVDKVAFEPAGTRPADSSGTNYLLVGSDSREGLTPEQRSKLGTGNAGGRRTDTIMVLHVPGLGGAPTLVSIPRDSYVPIPGHGRNKINAAFAFGGPKLLTETVENATGLRMDDYVEIGFGGFVGVVEGLGGVEMCLEKPIKDKKAHIDLPAGCQVLNGPDSLGFVRARYFDPKGDLGRVERQRQFLAAVMKETLSPSTLINPIRYTRVGLASGDALSVGESTGVIDTARFALAMRAVSSGAGITTTVPISDPNYSTPAGSAVRWDRTKALALFRALQDDQVIPPSLIPKN